MFIPPPYLDLTKGHKKSFKVLNCLDFVSNLTNYRNNSAKNDFF